MRQARGSEVVSEEDMVLGLWGDADAGDKGSN